MISKYYNVINAFDFNNKSAPRSRLLQNLFVHSSILLKCDHTSPVPKWIISNCNQSRVGQTLPIPLIFFCFATDQFKQDKTVSDQLLCDQFRQDKTLPDPLIALCFATNLDKIRLYVIHCIMLFDQFRQDKTLPDAFIYFALRPD